MVQDPERAGRVREALAASRLDALVCRLPENLVLLTGYYPIIGQSIVVFPAEGEATLIAPTQEGYLAAETDIADVRLYDCWRLGDPSPAESQARLLRQVAAEKRLGGSAIGFEDAFTSVAPPQMAGEPPMIGPAWSALLDESFGPPIQPATELLDVLRATKTPLEVERLRRANRVASLALATFKEETQPGRTEVEVGAAVERAVMTLGVGFEGARSARGFAQVMAGPNAETAWYYPVSNDRRIARGDLVVIELGAVVDGYWSDLTRTVAAGPASDRQREVYEAVKRAQMADLAACQPGARGDEVDAVGRRLLGEVGLARYFLHHTGHGLGFHYHEPYPWLHPDSRQTLAVGHVHSIEPGVYIPGFGGVRLEDDVAVLASGAEFLSRTDFGLD